MKRQHITTLVVLAASVFVVSVVLGTVAGSIHA